MENITRKLSVSLTEEEQLEIGLRLADLEINISTIEFEKSAMMKEYNDDIKGKEKDVLDLSRTLKAGEKEEEVECYWTNDDPAEGQKTLYRFDTAEKLETDFMELFDVENEEQEKMEEETVNAE